MVDALQSRDIEAINLYNGELLWLSSTSLITLIESKIDNKVYIGRWIVIKMNI